MMLLGIKKFFSANLAPIRAVGRLVSVRGHHHTVDSGELSELAGAVG